MVNTILFILAAMVAIPVALIVAWKLLMFGIAIISDIAGLVFAIIVVAIIMGIVVCI